MLTGVLISPVTVQISGHGALLGLAGLLVGLGTRLGSGCTLVEAGGLKLTFMDNVT